MTWPPPPLQPEVLDLARAENEAEEAQGGTRDSVRVPLSPGEREVCGFVIAMMNGASLGCDMEQGHDGAHTANIIAIPSPLAQRILAALELQRIREENVGLEDTAETLHALAAELRAALPQEVRTEADDIRPRDPPRWEIRK